MTPLDRALAAYDAILRGVGDRAPEIGPRPVASQWPHLGSAYRPGGLMVIGQALDGWGGVETEACWPAERAATAEGRARVIAGTRAWHADGAEPLWEILKDPTRRGSPFWQITRKLTESLTTGSEPWYARLAWFNTYPLGRERLGALRSGSPTGALKEVQDPHAGELLVALVDDLDPGLVVALSGPTYWWGIRQRALPPFEARPMPLIASQVVNGRSWVVGYHPKYTRQRKVTDHAYAERLVEEAITLRAAATSSPS